MMMTVVLSIVFSLVFVFDWSLSLFGRKTESECFSSYYIIFDGYKEAMLRFVWQTRDLKFGMGSSHQGLLNLFVY